MGREPSGTTNIRQHFRKTDISAVAADANRRSNIILSAFVHLLHCDQSTIMYGFVESDRWTGHSKSRVLVNGNNELDGPRNYKWLAWDMQLELNSSK